jgi:hypothetical protein
MHQTHRELDLNEFLEDFRVFRVWIVVRNYGL